ncbi:MAG TPA: hypothetical protein VLX30_02365 [Burkholderiales bacterium]|nr:hypothetical protein [Burkholderiales bacterium]
MGSCTGDRAEEEGLELGGDERLPLVCHSYGDEQLQAALASKQAFEKELLKRGFGKNPNGYCGLGGTGVTCPAGVLAKA